MPRAAVQQRRAQARQRREQQQEGRQVEQQQQGAPQPAQEQGQAAGQPVGLDLSPEEHKAIRRLKPAQAQALGRALQAVLKEAQLAQRPVPEAGLRAALRRVLKLPPLGTPTTGEPPGPETTPRKRLSPSDAPT
jgi:hypothetical protein